MATSQIILDTDILSEYLKGHDPSVVARAKAYARRHTRFTFTSVTAYEIVLGLESKGAASQTKRALDRIALNEQIVPTEADYITAARIKARARRQGRIVELPDSLIAAVASRLGFTLVTGNTADFEAIRDTGLKLTIENWRISPA